MGSGGKVICSLVGPRVAESVRKAFESVQKRSREFACGKSCRAIGIVATGDFSMSLEALNSLRPCVNRVFCSVACYFAAQAQCFGRLFSLPCHCDLRSRGGRFEASCLAGARCVCAGVLFVGPVVQSARFGELERCQNWSKSLWRHNPALVLDACRKRVKVGFRGRCSSLDDFEFVASAQHFRACWLNFVAGTALWSFSCKFCGRCSTLAPGCRFRGRHVHFDSATSLSLWRGAHFENAK